jgi:hypothetical protein
VEVVQPVVVARELEPWNDDRDRPAHDLGLEPAEQQLGGRVLRLDVPDRIRREDALDGTFPSPLARASEAARSSGGVVAKSSASIRERPKTKRISAITIAGASPTANGRHGKATTMGSYSLVASTSSIQSVPSAWIGNDADRMVERAAVAWDAAVVASTWPSVPHRSDARIPGGTSPIAWVAKIAGSIEAPTQRADPGSSVTDPTNNMRT